MGEQDGIICCINTSQFDTRFNELGNRFYLIKKFYSKELDKICYETVYFWFYAEHHKFLVQEFEGKNNDICFYYGSSNLLAKYKYLEGKNKLVLCKRYPMKDCTFEKNYIRDNNKGNGAFIIGEDTKQIYLPKKNITSRPLSKIFYDASIKLREKSKMENVLLVQETYLYREDVIDSTMYDEIIYGIDPTTLKIKTKIYSKIQDRFIDLFTKEEIKEAKLINPYKEPKYIDFEYLDVDRRGSNTIYYSIILPLEEKISKALENNPNGFDVVDDAFVKRIIR